MNSFSSCCLGQLITFVVIGIIMAIVLPLNTKVTGPRFYMKEFYVPALDLSQHTTPKDNNINSKNNTLVINPCLFFDLAFVNIQNEPTVSYGDVNVTFSYGQKTVANYVIPSFIQAGLETDYRREVVESRGVPWENVLKAVSNGSTVVFRVDLAARTKYDLLNAKKKNVRIGADVEVDGTGLKVKREDIILDSAATQRGVGVFVLFLSLLVPSLCLFF